MKKIAFVTQKGGAGKSTLSSNLAVAARMAGERVFICDLDPLQSLVKWSRARKTPDVPVQHVPAEKLAQTLERLAAEGVTLVVIDTPSGEGSGAEQAILAADVCIIPARPNVLDIWASEVTLARVKAVRKDFAFLLNQCPPAQQSVRVERGAQALQEMGALLAPLVTTRVDYQEAVRLGVGVGELNPNGVAAREMRKLWASLRARLGAESARAPGPAPAAMPEIEARYRDLLDQAVKVHDFYAGFFNALNPFGRAKPGEEQAAEAPPEEAEARRRR